MAISANDVRLIITTDLEDLQVESFISQAEIILGSKLTASDIDSALFDLMISWYAAHLISVTHERQTSEEKIGDASAKYVGKFGEDLHASSYGQMVISLDPSGKLTAPTKKAIKVSAIKECYTPNSSKSCE